MILGAVKQPETKKDLLHSIISCGPSCPALVVTGHYADHGSDPNLYHVNSGAWSRDVVVVVFSAQKSLTHSLNDLANTVINKGHNRWHPASVDSEQAPLMYLWGWTLDIAGRGEMGWAMFKNVSKADTRADTTQTHNTKQNKQKPRNKEILSTFKSSYHGAVVRTSSVLQV